MRYRKNNAPLILAVQEEERRRISRDLHDSIVQNLVYLTNKVEFTTMLLDDKSYAALGHMQEIAKALRKSIGEMRDIIFELRPMPFDDLGFVDAVDRLISHLNKDMAFRVETHFCRIPFTDEDVLLNIYRIIQEALANAIKHSGGSAILVSFTLDEGDFCLSVRDNGQGFDPKNLDGEKGRHFGLSMLRERVRLVHGRLKIQSVLGKGTKLICKIPIAGQK